MISWISSIRIGGSALLVLSFTLGVIAAWLWLSSTNNWQRHLLQANSTGQALHASLKISSALPQGLSEIPMQGSSQALANSGKFAQIPNIPRPTLLTYVTLHTGGLDVGGQAHRIVIISADLQYPISELNVQDAREPSLLIGDLLALMTRYCSDATLFISVEEGLWHRFEGADIWGCAATPSDRRLLAILMVLIAFFGLTGLAINASSQFTVFASQLKSSRNIGGFDVYRLGGPAELRSIIKAMNSYRDMERGHLAERALVLSGVTHDLGTPAMRLKLRAELIEDTELRGKLLSDINQMTGIIESVLTYTRSELSVEEPRQISLPALVQSIVADYTDVGKPVEYIQASKVQIEGAGSVFMSRRSRAILPDAAQIVLSARPIALTRAITNLIDNALKYGRRARVSLTSEATHAQITIEDEGGQTFSGEFENMMSPFARGGNAASIQGFGLGLTIASAITLEHGGTLEFHQGDRGLVVTMSIARGG